MASLSDAELSKMLRALRVDPPDDGFTEALDRRLAQEPPPGVIRLRGWGKRLGWLALAAILIPASLYAAVELGQHLLAEASPPPAPAPPPAPRAAAEAKRKTPAARMDKSAEPERVDAKAAAAPARAAAPVRRAARAERVAAPMARQAAPETPPPERSTLSAASPTEAKGPPEVERLQMNWQLGNTATPEPAHEALRSKSAALKADDSPATAEQRAQEDRRQKRRDADKARERRMSGRQEHGSRR